MNSILDFDPSPPDATRPVPVIVRTRSLLQAAINGARPPAAHVGIPVSPVELAAEARAAVAAGARELHLHVRAADGRESLAALDVRRVLAAVRTRCPDVPVGLSTGAWIIPDPDERRRVVASWSVLPDYVSVNFDEPGAAMLAADLLGRGVGIEAGLSGALATELLDASGLGARCLRILLEPPEPVLADALRTVAAIEEVLPPATRSLPRLLHGVDATAWPLIREAGRRGYQARIGFEDVVTLPDGTPASSNAELVQSAVRLLDDPLGRGCAFTLVAGRARS